MKNFGVIELTNDQFNNIISNLSEDLFLHFKDKQNNDYLFCHGVENGLVYLPSTKMLITADMAYDICTKRGYIENGQNLSIICCYGKQVSTCKYYNNNKNISFINKTDMPLRGTFHRTKNGDGKFVYYSSNKKSFIGEIKRLLVGGTEMYAHN